jgi:hypothetical protein
MNGGLRKPSGGGDGGCGKGWLDDEREERREREKREEEERARTGSSF